MNNVFVSRHPFILDKIAKLRDKNTSILDFRRLTAEISMFLGYEALKDAKTRKAKVPTPLGFSNSSKINQEVIFVAILRAGLGMLEGLSKLYPEAKLAHIGIYRNEETLEPVRYYSKLPRDIKESLVILADPMLATGGSVIESVNILKAHGAGEIRFIALIAARNGIERLRKAHPGVPIYVGAVDDRLNEKGYIVPGLGDAGDRMFGTN
ncbi:MAG: uracil phosphoribosyltransferase [Elusimicrobia bacterium]|nr:uracil phosphoribosyltransferase [Elusimicrobiota bacterium]